MPLPVCLIRSAKGSIPPLVQAGWHSDISGVILDCSHVGALVGAGVGSSVGESVGAGGASVFAEVGGAEGDSVGLGVGTGMRVVTFLQNDAGQ